MAGFFVGDSGKLNYNSYSGLSIFAVFHGMNRMTTHQSIWRSLGITAAISLTLMQIAGAQEPQPATSADQIQAQPPTIQFTIQASPMKEAPVQDRVENLTRGLDLTPMEKQRILVLTRQFEKKQKSFEAKHARELAAAEEREQKAVEKDVPVAETIKASEENRKLREQGPAFDTLVDDIIEILPEKKALRMERQLRRQSFNAVADEEDNAAGMARIKSIIKDLELTPEQAKAIADLIKAFEAEQKAFETQHGPQLKQLRAQLKEIEKQIQKLEDQQPSLSKLTDDLLKHIPSGQKQKLRGAPAIQAGAIAKGFFFSNSPPAIEIQATPHIPADPSAPTNPRP